MACIPRLSCSLLVYAWTTTAFAEAPNMAPMPKPHPLKETHRSASTDAHMGAHAQPRDVIEGCIARLQFKGVTTEEATLPKEAQNTCAIDTPVRLVAVKGASGEVVTFPDRPLLACTMADTVADFARTTAMPLARGHFGEPLAAIGTGPGFECRSRNHVAGAKLSAHANGLAIDIATLKLAGGKLLSVEKPEDNSQKTFLSGLRAGACGHFHTVIGPGADEAHANHIHADLEKRGQSGRSKLCE